MITEVRKFASEGGTERVRCSSVRSTTNNSQQLFGPALAGASLLNRLLPSNLLPLHPYGFQSNIRRYYPIQHTASDIRLYLLRS